MSASAFRFAFFFIVAKFVTGQIEVKSLTLNAAHAGHIHRKGRGDGLRSSMAKLFVRQTKGRTRHLVVVVVGQLILTSVQPTDV